MSSGCGCTEVYRYPNITYPTPLVSALFCSSIPTFCSFFKMFFVLVNLWNAKCNKIPRSNVAEISHLFKCVCAKRSLHKRL